MRRSEISKENWGKISNSGQGGFLNPPTHPEHYYCVSGVYENTFYLNLSSAVKEEWLDDECKREAKKLLKNWKKPDLKSEEIQDWVYHVLGYFKGCYTSFPYDRNVNSDCMFIDSKINPILNQNYHLGVLLIREYYPEFILQQRQIDNAYWGKKKAI